MKRDLWIRLETYPAGSSIAVNMSNVWRLDGDRDGGAEIHSLGANTGGVSASVRVKQSVEAILAMMEREGTGHGGEAPLAALRPRSAGPLLYRSSNGDEWTLERDAETGAAVVVHRANGPSGSFESRLDIERFLSAGGDGPERQALLRLIGTLV